MVSIKPGATAEIVFEGDETNHSPRLQTFVYATEERRLTLSQSAPPVPEVRLGKRLLLTFLETSEGVSLRYGFWARLKGFKDYELSPGRCVPVLVVEQETEPKRYNLRMNFRVKPMMNRGLTVFFQGQAVTIVDISVGGVRIGGKNDFPFAPQDIVKLAIGVDGARFDVGGRVIRTWRARPPGGGAQQSYASIQFIDNQSARESVLGKKIILLERESLAHK